MKRYLKPNLKAFILKLTLNVFKVATTFSKKFNGSDQKLARNLRKISELA